MSNVFFIVMLVLLFSCSNNGNSYSSKVVDDSLLQSDTGGVGTQYTPDFLKLTDESSLGFRGNFQGVEENDSAGPYIFKEYFSDTLSFRLVFVPKNLDKKDITFDSVAKARIDDFKKYLLLAFVYPMKNPDETKNDSDQIKYPLTVTTYVKNKKKLATSIEIDCS